MPEAIRLLLVDDEWLVRAGLRTMLSGDPDIEIVGEAADGDGIAELVAETGATVVLMDIRMPGVNGLTAAERLCALPSPPHVVMLTTFDADDLVVAALRAGASGFLLKDTPPADLVAALHAVVAGDPILSPQVTRRLIEQVTEPDRDARSATATRQIADLTPGEQRVAVAVAQGLSNADIARELFVTVATVKSHISHILDKLALTNRVQIALLVHDAGVQRT
ncbi:response regulator [Williamsia herbipolensis]|uniref:response regulator n=1 Tax=Williamsia herbipolensis TaxID=1603258 RepID=UPI0005F85BC5|nr:response regulator transcription factor [Williamsia herbipolensis]MCX6468745.1 response regulator transcription factor [Mycobacteriales bacterium]